MGESIRVGYWRPTFTGREHETQPARLGNVGRPSGGRIHPGCAGDPYLRGESQVALLPTARPGADSAITGRQAMNFCPTGKQPYPSPTSAWNVIQFLASKAALKTHKASSQGGGYAYQCHKCGQWHMSRRSLSKDQYQQRTVNGCIPLTGNRHEAIKARRWQWQEEARG